MAKRKAKKAARPARPARKASSARRSAKRPTARKASVNRKASVKKRASVKKSVRPLVRAKAGAATAARRAGRTAAKPARQRQKPIPKTPRLDRARRTLDDTVPSPPSSLDLDRNASSARSGRAEFAQKVKNHRGMTDVNGGDPDVDIEDAYFTGEEAPGGDNPTPDQDIVDDIGKALGVEYEDNEELKAADKVVERDKHRWELDPASSEDYKERK
jgi:hypothetical protein